MESAGPIQSIPACRAHTVVVWSLIGACLSDTHWRHKCHWDQEHGLKSKPGLPSHSCIEQKASRSRSTTLSLILLDSPVQWQQAGGVHVGRTLSGTSFQQAYYRLALKFHDRTFIVAIVATAYRGLSMRAEPTRQDRQLQIQLMLMSSQSTCCILPQVRGSSDGD